MTSRRWILLLSCILFGLSVNAAAPDAPKAEASVDSKSEAKGDSKADAKADKKTEPTAADPVTPAVGITQSRTDTCLPEQSVVEDLKKRGQELDGKEKALKTKELELTSRESAISEELKKLDQIRKEISNIKAQRRQKNEEQVTKLIETIERMSPKTAAPLLSRVDEDLAVAAMQGLSTDRLAKIMANMEVARSVRLSELLAMGENAPNHETPKGGAGGSSAH
jgi:flagellar motility protein MotE (MotC chaperone)